jgi:hypothetical protein
VPIICDKGDIVVTDAFVVAAFYVAKTCASDVAGVAASGVATAFVPSVAPLESPPVALAIAAVAAASYRFLLLYDTPI